MSEAPAADAPKKKGKLPIILVLVLVLGGGGFYMKSKGAKKAKPKTELAKTESMIELKDEFLVNLLGGNTYLRAKISLLPSSLAKKEELEHATPVIMDTIYARLRKTSIRLINSPEGMTLLKRQIASDVNFQLELLEKKEPVEPEPDTKKKHKKDEPDEPEPKTQPEITKLPAPDEVEHPEWDNDEGPILKVFFTSFATQ